MFNDVYFAVCTNNTWIKHYLLIFFRIFCLEKWSNNVETLFFILFHLYSILNKNNIIWKCVYLAHSVWRFWMLFLPKIMFLIKQNKKKNSVLGLICYFALYEWIMSMWIMLINKVQNGISPILIFKIPMFHKVSANYFLNFLTKK